MYDLEKFKEIPLEDVCNRYGISLSNNNHRLWGKLRAEDKTASFSIDINKNSWCDFGNGNQGGGIIQLVMTLEGYPSTKDGYKQGIDKIALLYGFENEKSNGWMPITDNQY